MKSYLVILMSLLFCGCSVKNDIVGKHMSKNNPNYFQFREDHTFIYEYRSLHLYKQSVGRWKEANENLIILNSEIKDVNIPLNVNNKNMGNGGNNVSIKFNIEPVRNFV